MRRLFKKSWGIIKSQAYEPRLCGNVLLALLLFGPKRLPEIARQMGKFMAEFKRASNHFQGQFQEEIRKLELEEADPRKHLEPEIAKISADEDLSIQGALNRLSERMKNTIPRDYDA